MSLRNILTNIYQITCIASRCFFFSISFFYKNDDDDDDDDIIRRGREGGGRKVMIGIIISENYDNYGPPLRQRKIEKKKL